MRALHFTAIVAAMIGVSAPAGATLLNSYQFNGTGNWSLDACGSNSGDPLCTIEAEVPTGSTVEKAFLYSSMNRTGDTPMVDFDGTTYSGGDWTSLGSNNFLEAYRTDVTSQVSSTVGSGAGTPFSFNINSEDPNFSIDGEALAIVYSNPGESERTIGFLDGATDSDGDSFAINLDDPLDTSVSGFEAVLSLGIGYGFQSSSQASNVDVNGRRLTSCAGGQDDGGNTNGSLITIGGLGDSTDNPDPDCTALDGPRVDDELYDLSLGNAVNSSPFITDGISTINVDTENPSQDDNIFFSGINITASATIEDEETTVPEPATLMIFGAGLAGIGWSMRRQRSKA